MNHVIAARATAAVIATPAHARTDDRRVGWAGGTAELTAAATDGSMQ